MTANRFAALTLVFLYLAGLAAWSAGFGVPAFIVGVPLFLLFFGLCIITREGTPPFQFALVLTGGTIVYMVVGLALFFLGGDPPGDPYQG